MSYNIFPAVVMIPANKLTAANNFFEKHGYGPDNFQKAIIKKTDPDDQAARGYIAAFQADMGLLALLDKIKEMDITNVKIIIGNNARKRVKIILDENDFRLKPAV